MNRKGTNIVAAPIARNPGIRGNEVLKIYNDENANVKQRETADVNLGINSKKPPPLPKRSFMPLQAIKGSSRADENVVPKGVAYGSKNGKMQANNDGKTRKNNVLTAKAEVSSRRGLADVSGVKGYLVGTNASFNKTQETKPHTLAHRSGFPLNKRHITSKLTRKSMVTVKPLVQREPNVSTTQRAQHAPSQKKMSAPISKSSLNREKNVSVAESVDVHQSASKINKVKVVDSNENSGLSTTRLKGRRRKSFTSTLVDQSEGDMPIIDDATNPLEVPVYVHDIYEYYWIAEAENASLADYMKNQTDITPKMRAILINWLIEVHRKFKLLPESLFLMVELLDRFLSVHTVRKIELQLVGLTALLIASKYEDFWHPKVNELISLSDYSCRREQMLSTEVLILSKLGFRLNIPTPYVFMRRFLKAAQADRMLENLSYFLIEISEIKYQALKFMQSLRCAAAIYVARCTLHVTPSWTELLKKHTRYQEEELRSCAEMILRFHSTASAGELHASYDKYLSSRYCSVARIPPIDKLPL